MASNLSFLHPILTLNGFDNIAELVKISKVRLILDVVRIKTMVDKFMYIHNDFTQKYPYCRL